MPRLIVPFFLLVLLLMLLGALGVTWFPRAARLEAMAVAPRAEAELAVQDVRRCPQCGWIESKREVQPSTYEYTVRMADGSSSVFLEVLPASWRLRERLIVIGGARPRN